MNNTFISNIAQNLADFLSFKNALGIEYKTSKVYLHSTSLIYTIMGMETLALLQKKVAEGWAMQHANKSTSQDRSCIPPIREFGRYLRSIGDNNAYVLDSRFTIQHYHAEVYLMTDDEIQSFFKECDSYVLKYKALGRPYVLPALYRFLYCCGARCAEARNLKCENVHLDKGHVDILRSKAHRDRMLYLSDELLSYLTAYNKAIETCFPNRRYFFPGGYGGICSATAVLANFRNIWIAAGLKRMEGSSQEPMTSVTRT